MAGEKFGRWVVTDDNEVNKQLFCKCECGNERWVDKRNLQKNLSKSCGCLQRQSASKSLKTHGDSYSRLYRIFANMKTRCTNPNTSSWENYGGRGITLCDEWMKFETFKQWATTNGYSDDLSIDRIDNDKGYYPENCRWATRVEQNSNTRNNIFIYHNGEKLTLKQFSETTDVDYKTMQMRYKSGVRGNMELSKPVDPDYKCNKFLFKGEWTTFTELSLKYDIHRATLYSRYERGLRDDEILHKRYMRKTKV